MSNWPNIEEYRNFEAKFYNNSIAYDNLNGSSINGEVESIANELIDFDVLTAKHNEKITNLGESKTIRCVIKNDFEENFKKFDRGDGISVNHRAGDPAFTRPEVKESAVAVSDMATDRRSIADSIRLENHYKWKKQKEEEYLQKKMAEKLAQQKRKEEEMLMEKLKKQKEKEREEKLREWQEQKAREKEGKKREKMVMKVLEEELKETIPVIDKEKLIENWVKLKDKQRQIDAEKKAEILKREEENRALRQSLAALSYRQWKEKIKGKNTALPKNGYQIFGPKPVPVVKEDWNHNFTNNSPRQKVIGLVGSKSSTTTNIMNSLSYQSEMKDLENFSLNLGRKNGELKTRSPSFYHLKNIKSKLDLSSKTTMPPMPLKELQTGTMCLKKNSLGNLNIKTNIGMRTEDRLGINTNVLSDFCSPRDESISALNFSPQNEDQDLNVSPPRFNNDMTIKKKIDLYLNSSFCDVDDDDFRINFHMEPTSVTKLKSKESKKGLEKKSNAETESKNKFTFKKTSTSTFKKAESSKAKNQIIRESEESIQKKKKNAAEEIKRIVQVQPVPSKKNKIVRHSKSFDKPNSIVARENLNDKVTSPSGVKRMVERNPTNNLENKPAKSPNGQKRRIRKLVKSNSAGAADKKKFANNAKVIGDTNSLETNKKLKKKAPKLNIFSDSPYNTKKTTSKSMDKLKSSGKRKLPKKDSKEEIND